jgi:hypothetical protein
MYLQVLLLLRQMQASYAVKLPCTGTQQKGHFFLYNVGLLMDYKSNCNELIRSWSSIGLCHRRIIYDTDHLEGLSSRRSSPSGFSKESRGLRDALRYRFCTRLWTEVTLILDYVIQNSDLWFTSPERWLKSAAVDKRSGRIAKPGMSVRWIAL